MKEKLMIKIQIKSIWGKVLFEYEKENNTIKETLEEAVKQNANLWNTNLRNTNLEDANLRNANLEDANLEDANLRNANLWNANLEDANLEDANLRSANLWSANLEDANLRNANLRNANLEDANLKDANLWNANLRNANLRNANLEDANLIKIKAQTQVYPEEGSFIAWKKCSDGCVVKIEIPARAKRTGNFKNRKCRASYVKTLAIYQGGKELKECRGQHDCNTIYKVGRITRPDKYDPDPRLDCSHGIHFFITRKEAEDW